jgi:hypothetical protein
MSRRREAAADSGHLSLDQSVKVGASPPGTNSNSGHSTGNKPMNCDKPNRQYVQVNLKAKVNTRSLSTVEVELFRKTTGMCFRLTFKWAACALTGHRFHDADFTEKQALKTFQKHAAYRTESVKAQAELNRAASEFMAVESADFKDFGIDAKVADFAKHDLNVQGKFITQWGLHVKEYKTKSVFQVSLKDLSTLNVEQYLRENKEKLKPPYAIIYTFYGLKSVKKISYNPIAGIDPNGHVVGLCTNDYEEVKGPVFFDSNSGWYSCNGIETMGAEVMEYLQKKTTIPRDYASTALLA